MAVDLALLNRVLKLKFISAEFGQPSRHGFGFGMYLSKSPNGVVNEGIFIYLNGKSDGQDTTKNQIVKNFSK